jgi:DNA-directed RNA polymerase beta subunit
MGIYLPGTICTYFLFYFFYVQVHTPDGSPCGLLNHVTASTEIVTHFAPNTLLEVLYSLGVIPHHVLVILPEEQVD